jgi:hypothetical protein
MILNIQGLSIKERRSHPRILKDVTEKFGRDDPIHNGISYDFSSNGMSIITNEVLPSNSNITIKIETEIGGAITVEGEVVWVSSIPDLPSKMGFRFKESNEKLVRIYAAKKPRSK